MQKEFLDLNKQAQLNFETVVEQNKELKNVDNSLNAVDDKLKITEKYLSGFKSIFGFFPKLFTSSANKSKSNKQKEKTTTTDKIIKVSNNNYNTNEQKEEYKSKNDNANNIVEIDAELEQAIYNLNNNAKSLKAEIDLSYKQLEKVDKHFDKTESKVKSLVQESKTILKKM